MHALVESKRQAVADLCRRSGVKRLEVFGSATRDDFDVVSSDVDLLVEFDDTAKRSLAAFFDLKDALEQVFARPVDLVMPDAVRNPYVRAAINRDRQVLYDA